MALPLPSQDRQIIALWHFVVILDPRRVARYQRIFALPLFVTFFVLFVFFVVTRIKLGHSAKAVALLQSFNPAGTDEKAMVRWLRALHEVGNY
jgi:hypothetical protein